METRSVWRRVQTSVLSLFALQLITALLVALAIAGLRPASWVAWLLILPISFIYAIVLTVFAKRQRNKYIASLGLSDVQQLPELSQALRKNTLPTNKEALQALPAYLSSRSAIASKSKKSLAISMAAYVCLIPISFLGHDWIPSIIFGLLSAATLYSFYILSKTQRKIAEMEITLTSANIPSNIETIEAKDVWGQTNFRSRAIISVTSAVFYLALRILMPIASANAVSQQSHPFTSVKDNFTISFPGVPSATALNATTNSGNVAIPSTIYASNIDGGLQNYAVVTVPYPQQVADFTGLTQPAMRSFLRRVVNTELQSSGSTLVSTKDETIFSGHTVAEEIQFTNHQNGHASFGYYRAFIIGNVQYSIIAQGSSRAAFEHFANSFQFTGQNDVSNDANETVKFRDTDEPTVAWNILSRPTGQPDSGTVSGAPDNIPTHGTFSSAPDNVPSNGIVTSDPPVQGTLIMVDPLTIHSDSN